MTINPAPTNDKKSTIRTRLLAGILLILVGLAIMLLFGVNMQPGLHSTFGLTPQGDSNVIPIPDMVLPAQTAIYVLALVTVFLGAWQLARGVRSTNLLVGLVAFCFVAAFLIWAAKGNRWTWWG